MPLLRFNLLTSPLAVLLKFNSLDTGELAEQTFQQWVKQAAHSKKVQSLLYILGRLATYCHAPDKVTLHQSSFFSKITPVRGATLDNC
jgi:hypothetical protein